MGITSLIHINTLFAIFLNMYSPPNINYLYSGTLITSLGWVWSVFTGDGFLGTGIDDDDKLEDTLSLGKTVVVTGWNFNFSLSIGVLVTISSGDFVATTVTSEIVGVLDV